MPDLLAEQAGPVYCEPMHIRHLNDWGLAWCEPCRAWHHGEYICPDAGRVTARRWDDPPEDEPVPECAECETAHDPGESCPRAFCTDCDDWHDGDNWGNYPCPGWYCEDCDDRHDYGEECPREYYGCDCEAPRQAFTVPNDGQPPLHSGERATVHVAAGVISDEGISEISWCLYQHSCDDERLLNLRLHLRELGNDWQTRQGNYTKRLSRLAYTKYGIKLTPEVMSEVGTIARDHSTAADVTVEVTRDLNRPAADFYHEDSCWWGSYSESRCALKTNGGFGLRSFDDGGRVNGRAWVLPLRRDGGGLVPTFDTETPDALVVFNGYGALSGYAAPRVIARMYGKSYAKIPFDDDTMYINSGGYIVGPEDIVRETKSLHMAVSQHASIHESELVNA